MEIHSTRTFGTGAMLSQLQSTTWLQRIGNLLPPVGLVMACKYCRFIDLHKLITRERIAHHPTFAELQACSSIGDCRVCVWITIRLERTFNHQEIRSEVYNAAEVYCYSSGAETFVSETRRGISSVCFAVDIGNSSLQAKAFVDIFAPQGSPLADSGVISGRTIAPYADDNSCLELARRWRDICLEEHRDSCIQSTEQILPTRVIDVGPSDGSRDPTLRITNGERGEWVALSHCWGRASRFVTDSSNLPPSERSMNLGDMPLTFRDAVIVTRQLGYQYLWIDSLCIVQDMHEDWVAESVRMKDYYKYAVLTISADSASGDHVGFLKHRREVQESFTITLTSNVQVDFRLPLRIPIFRDRDTHIAKRAWTLQEYVLTPRSLLYTSQQIIWNCHTSKFCESDENFEEDEDNLFYQGRKRFFSTPSLGKEKYPSFEKFFDPIFRWYSLVSDYFYRDLTLNKDILPAISGIAREIQNQTGKTYAAGVWIEELHTALLWKTSGCAKIPKSYHAPSWSWASLKSLPGAWVPSLEELYQNVIFSEYEYLEWRACYLSHEVVLEDGDPFGRVSSGSIRMSGRFLPTRLWQGKTKPHNNSYKSFFTSHFHDDWSIYLSMDQLVCNFDVIEEDNEEEDMEEGEADEKYIDDEANVVRRKLFDETIMFHISAWDWNWGKVSPRIIVLALLLLPVNDKPADTYRRVGMVEVPNFDGLAEKGWTAKEITIM